LRIDVDNPANGKNYGIPADNPFAAGGGAGEVFIYGVRNPWRWSVDRGTGGMWIGDVGPDPIEKLDFPSAGPQGGQNPGWSMGEANSCYGNYRCTPAGIMMPQDQRAHSTGWNAIIGGQVYRGTCYPDLVGTYIYSDNGHGGLTKAVVQGNMTLQVTD